MSIKLKDSELYDVLLEVCDELGYTEYMPTPCCMLIAEDTGKQLAIAAISIKTHKPFTEGEDIKTYISEFVESSVKKYGDKSNFYPFKIQKSDQGTKIILRGAFQQAGYKTIFKGDADKELIKTQLDNVESRI